MNFYKHYINIGSQSALASFAFFLLLYVLDINPLGNVSWLGAWIPILFIVRGTKQFRDKFNGGLLTYWKGVATGFFIAFFSASLFAFLIYIFMKVIDPSILDRHLTEIMEGIQKMAPMLSEEQFDMVYSRMEEALPQMTTGNIAMGDFWNKIIGETIVCFIVAAILRKTIILEPVNNQGSTTENNEHE